MLDLDQLQPLIDRLRTGGRDEECSRRLFKALYPRVYGFFAQRGFALEDRADLTQETLIAVFDGLPTYRGDAAGFSSWVFAIAANLYRRHLRWQGAQKRAGDALPLDRVAESAIEDAAPFALDLRRSPRPDQVVLDEEQAKRLREAVDSLPDKMRKCLILRVYHDRKYSEIATLLQISIDTVKSHLFQARQRLKVLLEEDVAPERSAPTASPQGSC